MLDFYLIPDDEPRPNNPTKLICAGGLDDRTFDNLQQKGIIGDRFDYYSNFRWDIQLIKQIQQTIRKKKMERDRDVQVLITILAKAEELKSGLVAYGD